MLSTTDLSDTLLRIGEALNRLAVRGLGVAGPDETAQLGAFRAELAEMGAMHLAGQLGVLLSRVSDDRKEAPRAFLHVHTMLRMLDRLYTLRRVEEQLATQITTEAPMPAVEPPGLQAVELPTEVKPSFLRSLSLAVEELLVTGMTAASEATVQTLRVGVQEASGRRLLRLGSTLRMLTEEIARFAGRQTDFSPERFVFFASRVWMLSRGMADALDNGDRTRWTRLAWTPPSRPVDELALVVCGVFKRHVPGAFASFEMRCRVLSDAGPVRAGEALIWSFVFPVKVDTEVPPEVHLLLKQKQKFVPNDLLEGCVVRVRKAALSLLAPPRLLLGPESTVEPGEPFAGFRDLMAWDPLLVLARVRAHRVDPLELPIELQEEVLLEEWAVGPFDADGGPYLRAPLTSGTLRFEVRVDGGAEGAPLKETIEKASGEVPKPPLFGFTYFEHGKLIFQPLSLLRAQGPEHVHLIQKNIDKTALVRALRFD